MSKLKTLAIFAAMALAVLGGYASEAFAAAEINVAPGRTLKGPGVAASRAPEITPQLTHVSR